jgi:hypothetical protein
MDNVVGSGQKSATRYAVLALGTHYPGPNSTIFNMALLKGVCGYKMG